MSRKNHNWKVVLPIYGPAVLAAAVVFVIALQYIKPAPPDVVVMATGEQGGAYYGFAEKYQQYLAREGIQLQLVQTAGSVENLELLQQKKVDLAFVQGGTRSPGVEYQLEGLASLYYEPLWLFHRDTINLDRIATLDSLQVAIGAEGSGTRSLVLRLLGDNKLQTDNISLLSLDAADAASQLKAGLIDAAFFVSSPSSELVTELLHAPGLQLASFQRAKAYTRRHRFLTELLLPEGAEDLQINVPQRDVQLLAPTASIVAGEDIHPAIAGLVMQALQIVHNEGGWFEQTGQFPNSDNLEFPLNEQAASYYRRGPPFLQRFLPFWAASLIDRMKVMLLPIFVMLIPMFKIMPPLYRWRMRARIYRWYEELEAVDFEFLEDGAGQRQKLLEKLDKIELEVRQIKVPLSFADQVYHLREHIDLVRQKLLDF